MSRHALLVGINGYPASSGLVPLKYAEADAAALAEVLRTRGGFSTTLLLGPQATRDAIEEALLSAGQGDTFLFFFGGHGQHLAGHYKLHPVDSTAAGLRALPFGEIADQWHHAFGYEQVVAVLDACRSETRIGAKGGRALETASARDIVAATHGNRWVEVLYGCSEGQCSYEVEELGHGLLTQGLLEVLCRREGEVDTTTLAGAAADWMRSWCRRDPEGRRQEAYRYAQPSLIRRVMVVGAAAKPVEPAELPPPIAPLKLSVAAVPSALIVCPICGRRNEAKSTFRCRKCSQDFLCLDHLVRDARMCQDCVAKEAEARLLEADRRKREDAEQRRQLDEQKRRSIAECRIESFTNSIGMRLKRIPAGRFVMGSREGSDNDYDEEGPFHQVAIARPFYMGIYPVTQAEWQQILGGSPSHFHGLRCPVERISHASAQQFCHRLSERDGRTYRLPTEAEWEYACRSGWATSYSFGDSDNHLGAYAWFRGNSRRQTHDVGQKRPNAWGLCDMHGNVWEWCEDWWHGNYDDAPTDGSPWLVGADQSQRVIRGGSWDVTPVYCRSAARAWHNAVSGRHDIGFRVCLQVP